MVDNNAHAREINSIISRFIKAFNNGQASIVASLYSKDSKLFPQNSDVVNSSREISSYWQSVLSHGIQSIELHSLESMSCEDTYSELTEYIMKDAKGEILDKGRQINLWKKIDGKWKIYRQMINSSLPCPINKS
jgi:ketosteroid isomerase-like protein